MTTDEGEGEGAGVLPPVPRVLLPSGYAAPHWQSSSWLHTQENHVETCGDSKGLPGRQICPSASSISYDAISPLFISLLFVLKHHSTDLFSTLVNCLKEMCHLGVFVSLDKKNRQCCACICILFMYLCVVIYHREALADPNPFTTSHLSLSPSLSLTHLLTNTGCKHSLLQLLSMMTLSLSD